MARMHENLPGQISIEEYLRQAYPRMTWGGCGPCICKKCLYWCSQRCPYGECYDDHRAQEKPYDAAHPDKPPRTGWSNWNKPGEQAHWCRGGRFYPTYECKHYVHYTGQLVKSCLEANVSVFQDGYIDCSLVDTVGCAECYRRFEEKMMRNE